VRNALFHKRSLAVAGLTAMAAIAGLTAGAGMAGASAASPSRAAAGGPGHWSQVTASGTPIIADIGLVRGADGVLHVIWDQGTPIGREKILDTPIVASGTAARSVTIASGLYTVTDPDATATPGGLVAFWNGIQNSMPNSPQGTFEATRPVRGGHWSVGGNVPPLPAVPYLSSSDSAGTGSDGKPWVAFTGTDSLAVVHLGHPEKQLPPTACCVYEPGLATDGTAGTTWLAYMSLITGNAGVYVQRLSPTGASGAPARLPGSETSGNVFLASQRIGITGRGRGRGGVYVAYAVGWPAATALDLLKLGTRVPVKLATFGGFAEELAGDTITAGPNGRLWVTWFDGNGTPPRLFVRASGTTGQTFGKTVPVALPAGTSVVYKVYTSAQAGRLDVIALLTRHGTTAYFATQVLLPPR
jgi:hypothetical protein